VQQGLGAQQVSHGSGREPEDALELLAHVGHGAHPQLFAEGLHRVGVVALHEEGDVQRVGEAQPGAGVGEAELLQVQAPGAGRHLPVVRQAAQGAHVGGGVEQLAHVLLLQPRRQVARVRRPAQDEAAEPPRMGELRPQQLDARLRPAEHGAHLRLLARARGVDHRLRGALGDPEHHGRPRVAPPQLTHRIGHPQAVGPRRGALRARHQAHEQHVAGVRADLERVDEPRLGLWLEGRTPLGDGKHCGESGRGGVCGL
jgi:hypothetical protein